MAKSSKENTLISSKHVRNASHVDEFKEMITKASDAAIGVILIRTREPYRCQEVLHEWSIAQEMEFKVWTILAGWQEFLPPSHPAFHTSAAGEDAEVDIHKAQGSDNAIQPPVAFQKIKEQFSPKGCFIFMNLQHFIDTPAIQQHIKDMVRHAYDNEKRVILLVPESVNVPTEIEDDLYIIDFKTPSHSELKTVWNDLLDNISDGTDDTDDCRPAFSMRDVDLIVQTALGMAAHEFDTAIALAFVELREKIVTDKKSVTPHDFIAVIMREKVNVIKRTDILELLPEADMSQVGGLDILKSWVAKRSTAFSDEARQFGIDMPKGVLMVGPPGTGKSLAAKAIASVLNVPCIKLDIGRIFGQYVGESEGRMRKALALVEAMAPCVLMIDEIDKGFGGASGASGDSGTTSRVFGTFLTWMQERQSESVPIFVVMTANNVLGLPPELMRKGRLDEIFAVTFPSDKERVDILKIHVEKRGHKLTNSELAKVAAETNNFVGSELEAVVKDSLVEAFGTEERKLTSTIMRGQAASIIPLYRAFAEKVKLMNDWAKSNAKPSSSNMSFDYEETKKEKKGKRIIRRGGSGIRNRKLKPTSRSSED